MVIVGAGLAGLTVAETLRAEGYAGPVTMIGDEPIGPYHRPPLSKGYLLGETQEAQLVMRAPEALEKRNIALRTGTGVSAIDRNARLVILSDGSVLAYQGLALCTGSRPRALPLAGADTLRGIYALRTLADSKAIAAALEDARDVVVIGGGFIGLEVAAAARKKGKSVTVLEAAQRLLSRSATPLMSDFYCKLHAENGVNVMLNAQVSELVAKDGSIAAVKTRDGREFAADLVVIGIGIVPNAELAEAADLECDGGIVVDACSRTNDPAIVAAGDCTARRMEDGGLRRLESVQNAVEQAKSGACALLGKERAFNAAPWFWSDQYDTKLQMAGASSGYDQVVMRGDPAAKKFSAFYYKAGRVVAIDSLNQPAEHMAARRMFEKGVFPTPEQAADTGFALNSLFA